MAYDKEADPVSANMLALQKARDCVAASWGDDFAPCIYVAVGRFCGLHQPAYLLMPLLGFANTSETFAYNDAPERTRADVVARFDTAIDRLARGVGG